MKEKINAVIKTDRLTLRPFEEGDLERTLAILTDTEVKKTYMLPDFASTEQAERLFRRFIELSGDPARFVYAVSNEEGIVGFLNDVERTETTVEMGYVIATPYWGRGYATEAFLAVIRELFAAGFTTVRAGAFSENIPSMRVMEKCGMCRTGETEIIPYRGVDRLCIYYEIRA